MAAEVRLAPKLPELLGIRRRARTVGQHSVANLDDVFNPACPVEQHRHLRPHGCRSGSASWVSHGSVNRQRLPWDTVPQKQRRTAAPARASPEASPWRPGCCRLRPDFRVPARFLHGESSEVRRQPMHHSRTLSESPIPTAGVPLKPPPNVAARSRASHRADGSASPRHWQRVRPALCVVEVEVEGELTLVGAHQALKYRTLRAGQLNARKPPHAFLVAYKIPKSVKKFYKRLGISHGLSDHWRNCPAATGGGTVQPYARTVTAGRCGSQLAQSNLMQ